MKKIFSVLTLVLSALLCGCGESNSIGIIGGSDGPTAVFVSSGTSNALLPIIIAVALVLIVIVAVTVVLFLINKKR